MRNKTFIFKDAESDEDIAVYMISWLANKFKIKPEALADFIVFLRKETHDK